MHNIYQKVSSFVFTLSFAAGMTGIALAQSAANQNQTTPPANSGMYQNNSNHMVRRVQRQLKQDGYYNGAVDGMNGPMTHAAIRRYQKSQNLSATGNLDRATLKSLGLSNNMQSNNMQQNQGEASRAADEPQTNSAANLSSDTVRQAQQKLAQKGFYNGRPDGVMNEGTRVALRQYQKANNLPENGRLTRETAQSMGITTNNANFENNQSPMEQLGKGLAEGAKSKTNNDRKHQ